MKQEFELQLQAYLDGELPSGEANQVKARIDSDAQARALYNELRQTALTLKGNEIERSLPESREFYWSRIEREINRLDAAPATERVPWWLAFVRRHLAAVSGVGVAAALLLFGAIQLNWLSPDLLEEIDNPLDEMTSLSFRSESQKLTVVWIGDRSNSTRAEDEPDPGEETIQ